jgi:L-alanine-DL-glutamate epimerase-like enolase superfamily enzyme
LRYVDPRDWPLFALDAEGHMAVPEAPGLGVAIDWAEVLKADGTGESWKDEEMRLPDGTLANW